MHTDEAFWSKELIDMASSADPPINHHAVVASLSGYEQGQRDRHPTPFPSRLDPDASLFYDGELALHLHEGPFDRESFIAEACSKDS